MTYAADATLLERAIALAVTLHAGQTDKAGAPYILHPLRVMMRCAPQHMAVAVLHDVLEDCPAFTVDRLSEAGFPQDMTDALVALTRQRGESYENFIYRVKQNPVARLVKIEDLFDNSDLSRIEHPTEADRVRTAKYARALHYLG